MHLLGFDPKDLSCSAGNASKQLGRIVRVQPIQRRPRQSSLSISALIPAPAGARLVCWRSTAAPNTIADC